MQPLYPRVPHGVTAPNVAGLSWLGTPLFATERLLSLGGGAIQTHEFLFPWPRRGTMVDR